MPLKYYFNNTSIRTKMVLFFLVFIVTQFYFMITSFYGEFHDYKKSDIYSKELQIAFSLSELLGELQKERYLLLAHPEHEDRKILNQEIFRQLNQTDKRFYLFRNKISEQKYFYNDFLESFLKMMEQRRETHQYQINKDDQFKFYQQLISKGLIIVQSINKKIDNQKLAAFFSQYTYLLKIQEQVALEKVILDDILYYNLMSTRQFQQLSSIVSTQQNYLTEFNLTADKYYTQMLNERLHHPSVQYVNSIRDNVLSRMQRYEILNRIQQLIGYGGLIHLFKNYVIRGTPNYYQKFIRNYKELDKLIREYTHFPNVTIKEMSLLHKIRNVFFWYEDKIQMVAKQKQLNKSIEAIDQMVKVDDTPAIKAINQLQEQITYLDATNFSKHANFKSRQFVELALLLEQKMREQLQMIKQSLSQHFAQFFLISFIITILMLVFAFYLFQRMQDIITIAESIKSNDRKQLLKIEGKDEIGIMASAFNDFISKQQKYEAKLKTALKKAEAGMVARSQFLSTMSHEIRTPLNGVLGMAELLSTTELDSEQKEYVETITNSGHLLLNIINDVLDFSKLEAHHVVLEKIPCNLEKIAYDAIHLFSSQTTKKDIELLFSYQPGLPEYFLSDPARLKQVFINLVNNAIKFTEKGHVLVSVSGEQCNDKQYQITCSVQDTGIGIAKDKQKKLFESFTQAEQSTSRKYGGTGLGLSICKQIVSLMGGEIKIDSTPGKGSNFYFNITLDVSDNSTRLVNYDVKGVRLLAVDDNPVNLSIIGKICAFYKIDYTLHQNPQTVMDLLYREKEQGRKFDIIILDHLMPVINGLELATQIKSDEHFKQSKLMLLTSSGVRGDAKKSHHIGFSAYHSKPIRSEILIQSIKHMLANDRENIDTLITSHAIEEAMDKRTRDKEHRFNGKVLLVEDNMVNQKIAAMVLKKLGLAVEIASDGLEAVEKYKNDTFDLIFMDCQMPHMNGYDATRTIREYEATSNTHVPVVALTANALVEDQQQCREAGMDDFIAKPFKKADIINSLYKWLKPK